MLNNEDYLNIFHEIKNSITLINGSLQLVEKKHPEVNGFDYWKEAMSEIDFLKNMVTQLSSARLCNHLNLTSINIYAFMQQINDSICILAETNFNCRFILSDSLPTIQADAQLLKQAVINLLKNAYEAMNETGTITLEVSFKEQTLNISITDYGGGLNPAFADNIFDPFITSKTGGSGLGLVITKQIIESHHGTISCDSRPGDGCTFTISIPVMQN